MTKSYHPSKKKEEKPYPRFTWLLDAKQVITDIARGEADLDTLKAGASLIPVAKITKVPKVVKAIGNVGKTGFKKGKEGEKIAKSGQAKQTKAKNKGGSGAKRVFDRNKIQWTATHLKGTRQKYEVHQRNDINWDKVRTGGDKNFIGKTNAEAAQKRGLAPQLNDGNFATLHHLGQDSRGGLVEASTRYHGIGKPGQDILHSQYGKNKPNPNHPINRKQFGYDTKEYWKWRERHR